MKGILSSSSMAFAAISNKVPAQSFVEKEIGRMLEIEGGDEREEVEGREGEERRERGEGKDELGLVRSDDA